MSRRDDLSPDDRRIWARVAGSVTPAKPKKAARIIPGAAVVDPPAAPHPKGAAKARSAPPSFTPSAPPARPRGLPELHGFGRFQAQDALTAFLLGAQARGYRSVLVITGQGRRGGTGVIRASVHEWLQGPALRGVVSGFASAARHHGGDGALYVTIRRG